MEDFLEIRICSNRHMVTMYSKDEKMDGLAIFQ